ncbi:MAG: 1-deoxyxylulose-5-phosphate synthase YajO [Chroococcidiopsis sp. SAG 2025]|uniref:aldo/keto reductase n=1 Tax=Chroococcidiopsis sp. SAG 2025 TaxID=171389 RepID=UPI002936E5A7|nr:aldo/keto reductase [Chroococcidiopsis sp. SAG 2025]MDV2998384.1 1-deoxyxylulose-5-phosphate synthase YajO [Chroococcidiopsis sp. SAG 2025]
MQYTTLGHTGLVISRLAFGAMTFGEGQLVPGVMNKIDQSIADQMVNQALDAGINLFDTADAYTNGQSEMMLGKALGDRRDQAVIATKVGFRTGNAITNTGLSYRHILASAEASLKRLGTDYIDLYQIHIPDPLTPPEETVRALDDLVRRGLVRYVGFCNLQAWRAARLLGLQERQNYARFVGAQMYYSLLGRDLEHEIVPFVEDTGIGVLVWSPLAGGFLSGKYTRENPTPEGARLNEFKLPPIDVEKGYEVVDVLKEIAQNHGATPAQVAIAWMLTKPFVSSVIIGANKMQHLDDNLGAIKLNLSASEIDQLETLTKPQLLYPGWMQAMGWDAKVKASLDAEWG